MHGHWVLPAFSWVGPFILWALRHTMRLLDQICQLHSQSVLTATETPLHLQRNPISYDT